jgi:hypothetical protein
MGGHILYTFTIDPHFSRVLFEYRDVFLSGTRWHGLPPSHHNVTGRVAAEVLGRRHFYTW